MKSKPNTGAWWEARTWSWSCCLTSVSILEKSESLDLLTRLCLSNDLWCHQGSLTPSSLALTGCRPHSPYKPTGGVTLGFQSMGLSFSEAET